MKPKQISVLVCAIAALLFASCADVENGSEHGGDSHVAHWGYEADNGPDAWSSMNSAWALCAKGREQSPIDLTMWISTGPTTGSLTC